MAAEPSQIGPILATELHIRQLRDGYDTNILYLLMAWMREQQQMPLYNCPGETTSERLPPATVLNAQVNTTSMPLGTAPRVEFETSGL
jgi:hypothetical protein